MTQYSDLLRQGKVPAFGPSITYSGNPRAAALSPGVEVPAESFRTFVPVTSVSNALAAVQVLSGAAFTLQATSGVTTTSIGGVTYLQFDVPRCILATGWSASTLPVTLSAAGLDEYQQPMTAAWSGPNGVAVTASKKAFLFVQSVTAMNNTQSGVALGQSDTMGFGAVANSFEEIALAYNGSPITVSTGFTQADTTTPSATTGDVRGTYALQSASNNAKRFSAQVYVRDVDTLLGVYGATQA